MSDDDKKVPLEDLKAAQSRFKEGVAMWECAGAHLTQERSSNGENGRLLRQKVNTTARLETEIWIDAEEGPRATTLSYSFDVYDSDAMFICYFSEDEAGEVVKEEWTFSGLESNEPEEFLERYSTIAPSFVALVRSGKKKFKGWEEVKLAIAEMVLIFLAVIASRSAPKST